MSFLALKSYPTSGPGQLGGSTPALDFSDVEILVASMKAVGHIAHVRLLQWDTDQGAWFPYPVDPAVADPSVFDGKVIQRYVIGKTIKTTSTGTYYCFLTDAVAPEDEVTISVRLTTS